MIRARTRSLTRDAAAFIARSPAGWRLMSWLWDKSHQAADHPIDIQYGIRTAGDLPSFLIAPRAKNRREIMPHLGCQTSCVRQAIESLPYTRDATFYDLGCGKGRALAIASEYPFKKIVGIEISSTLCRIARANVDVVGRNFPDRARIDVIEGDAAETAFSTGNLVVFFYHSFGEETLTRVLASLREISKENETTIIYENPVNGHLIDRNSDFVRWYGEQVPCRTEEIGIYPDSTEGVAVWRAGPNIAKRDGDTAFFDIVITKPGWRAEIARRGDSGPSQIDRHAPTVPIR